MVRLLEKPPEPTFQAAGSNGRLFETEIVNSGSRLGAPILYPLSSSSKHAEFSGALAGSGRWNGLPRAVPSERAPSNYSRTVQDPIHGSIPHTISLARDATFLAAQIAGLLL